MLIKFYKGKNKEAIMIAAIILTGIFFTILGLILGTKIDFLKGFIVGIIIALIFLLAIIVIRRIRAGKNTVKNAEDERQHFLIVRSGATAFAVLFLIIVIFIFISYSTRFPLNLKPASIGVLGLGIMSLLYGTIFFIYSKIY